MGKANEQAKDKPSLLNRWLNGIEKVGNKLPHPISIFAILVLFVIVLSAVCEMAGVSATGELVNRYLYDCLVFTIRQASKVVCPITHNAVIGILVVFRRMYWLKTA